MKDKVEKVSHLM